MQIFPSHHTLRRPYTKGELRWKAPGRCSDEAIPRAGRSCSRTSYNARHYSENVLVVRCQCASGGTGGCFGGAGSTYRPSSTNHGTRELEVSFPFPGRSRELRPVRLVYHLNYTTSTSSRLVSGDLLHFESVKRSRNVVLSYVVRERFRGGVVQHVFRNSACKYCGMSPLS